MTQAKHDVSEQQPTRTANRRLATRLALVTVAMLEVAPAESATV